MANKPIDTKDQATYDEPGSWGRLSEGWPETSEYAYEKYVFCNMTGVVPYGSYVFVNIDYRRTQYAGVLRVVDNALLARLNEKFKIVRETIIQGIR